MTFDGATLEVGGTESPSVAPEVRPQKPGTSRALSFPGGRHLVCRLYHMTYLAHFGIAVAAGLVVELLVRVFAA